MKKVLLAAGDSFTDQNCRSYEKDNVRVWPELLAKKLDMDYVNVAQAGAGNEQIYSSFLDWICANGAENVGLAIAGWSKCERMDFQLFDNLEWHNTRTSPRGNLHSWIKKSLRNMYGFQLVCEYHNIPYKQFQMISLMRDYIYENYKHDFENIRLNCLEVLMNSEQYDVINESNFIGWPIIDELGGFTVADKTVHKNWDEIHKLANAIEGNKFYKTAKAENKLVIAKEDPHPNQDGHNMIMEFIYENL